jgi:hypothetical protein
MTFLFTQKRKKELNTLLVPQLACSGLFSRTSCKSNYLVPKMARPGQIWSKPITNCHVEAEVDVSFAIESLQCYEILAFI